MANSGASTGSLALLLACLAATALIRFSGSTNAFLQLGSSQGPCLRSARLVADSPSAGPARFPKQESQDASSIAALLVAVGALAGASLSSRIPSRRTAMSVAQRMEETGKYRNSRKKNYPMYGGDGPPKVADWILKQGTDEADPDAPKWLTLQRWQAMKAPDRCRRPLYFKLRYDDKGNDITVNEVGIPEAIDQMFKFASLDTRPSDQMVIVCSMTFNLDKKFPDQQIRLLCNLPHSTGRTAKVAVFCPPNDEDEMLKMGAYKAGQTLADAIADEDIDFDVLICKPQMMPQIAKLGKILGPRRLTPSPKSGTVVQDYKEAIEKFSSQRWMELKPRPVDYTMQVSIGKLALGKEKLTENLQACLQEIADKAPAGAQSIKKLWKHVSISCKGPAIKIRESSWPNHVKGGIPIREESADGLQRIVKK